MTNQQSSNAAQTGADSSIDSILNDIKSVMSAPSQDEDVLVLTNEVESAPGSNENAQEDPAFQPGFNPADFGIQEGADILEEIDASFQPANTQVEENNEPLVDIKTAVQQQVREEILDSNTKDTVHDLITHFYKAKKESKHSDFRSGATIEDLVLEVLKPELKAWMERNIVDLVQKVIEKEIRKIMSDDQ